jgi:nicotinamidase-related amidase
MSDANLASTALLVIDVQQGFDDPRWGRRNNPDLETRVEELLAAWRGAGLPVLHARHMSTQPASPLRPGQPGNEFKSLARPRPDEPVFEKRAHSCFIGTALEGHLRRSGIGALVLAGLTTNHCVSTTARMGEDLGYAVRLVSDATATFDRTGPDGAVYPAEVVHAMALADLHGEFADVVDTRAAVAGIGRR